MRVLHVIATLRGGGAETLVRELLPRLRSRDLDVGVFSAYDPRLSADERAQAPYPIFEGAKGGRGDAGFGARAIAAIRRFRPHIVHTHTVTGKYWGRACALAAGVPHILHTEHSPQSRLASWEPPFAHLLVRRTDAFITFSERTAAFVAAREPIPRIEIIPNGISIDPAPTEEQRVEARRVLGAAAGSVVIGVVANLQPQKNHRLALEAFANLSGAERRLARLEFFGAGPQEAALRTLAARLGVGAAVTFWGFRSDVRRLLPGLDALLTVSTVEAAPISLLEAMSACLPILGTPHHGTLDLVQDGVSGIVIPDWSAENVTQALRRTIRDTAWRERAGRHARTRLVEEFDIERVADRHAALYRTFA
jgi:glycosyltransferase involved in cell wall biosynthesis